MPSNMDYILSNGRTVRTVNHLGCLPKYHITGNPIYRDSFTHSPMERFYNTFKSNLYNVTSFSSVEMMDELTAKYINWYNYIRPHSYNGYLTPMETRYM